MPTYATPEATLYDRINAQQLAAIGQPLADYGKAQADFAMKQALEREQAQQYTQRLFLASQLQAQAAAQQNAAHNQFAAEQNRLAREAAVEAAALAQSGRWQINQENILDRDRLLGMAQKQQDKVAAEKQKEADALRERAKGDVRALNGRLSQLEDAYQSAIAEATPLMDAAIEKAAISQAARTLGVSGLEFNSIVASGVTPAVQKKYPTLAGDIEVAKEALRKTREMFAPDSIRVKLNNIQRDQSMIRGLYDNALNTYGKLGGVMTEIFTENQPPSAGKAKEASPLPPRSGQALGPPEVPAGPAAVSATTPFSSETVTPFGAPTLGGIGRFFARPFMQGAGMGIPASPAVMAGVPVAPVSVEDRQLPQGWIDALSQPVSVVTPSVQQINPFAPPLATNPPQTGMMQVANGQWVPKLNQSVWDVYNQNLEASRPNLGLTFGLPPMRQGYPFAAQSVMPEYIQTNSPAAARFGIPQGYPFTQPVVQPVAPQAPQLMQLPDGSIVPRPPSFEDRQRYFQQMLTR